MTKLTDTQRVILSAASQRTDRLALPLPKSLKGGARAPYVKAPAPPAAAAKASSASKRRATKCTEASHQTLLQATSERSLTKTDDTRRKRCTNPSSRKARTNQGGEKLFKDITELASLR